MDAQKIASAARTIIDAESALKWLKEFGQQINGSQFDTAGCATACSGHIEAQRYLTTVLRDECLSIVEAAKMRCEKDIAAAQNAIRVEVDL